MRTASSARYALETETDASSDYPFLVWVEAAQSVRRTSIATEALLVRSMRYFRGSRSDEDGLVRALCLGD